MERQAKMTMPRTDEIKRTTSPHTFRIATGIDLTNATSVNVWWQTPLGGDLLVVGSKTNTPTDGIIEWTDTPSFWTSSGWWTGEAYVYFSSEKLVGDAWATPISDVLALS